MDGAMTDNEILDVLDDVSHPYEYLQQTAKLAPVARIAQVSSTSNHIIVDPQRLQLGMVLYPER